MYGVTNAKDKDGQMRGDNNLGPASALSLPQKPEMGRTAASHLY